MDPSSHHDRVSPQPAMMSSVRLDDVLRHRLATQRLTSTPLASAADVVRHLLCLQAQERDQAFFSLGLRSRGTTYAGVRAAHDAGLILRTHVLRPTWHLVTPEDLRWLLALTSPRVEASMRGRHQQLGLEPRLVGTAFDALTDVLAGPTPLTRSEIGDELVRRRIPVGAGPPMAHLLATAELRGLICSGPTKGGHHSYVLLDDVIPAEARISREEGLDRLARRFVAGHGPVSDRDLARWASLTLSDARAALASSGPDLERVEGDGVTMWFDESTRVRRRRGAPTTFLLPTYDEALIASPGHPFPQSPGHPDERRSDSFQPRVIQDQVSIGAWTRTLARGSVLVETRLAPGLGSDARERVRDAARRLADFLERDLDYREGPPSADPA